MVECSGSRARPKLLDFGLSRVVTRNAQRLGGTITWAAPEVFMGGGGRPKCSSDVYSFGLLIFFVATGAPPPDPGPSPRMRGQSSTRLPTWPPGCAFEAGCRTMVKTCLRAEEAGRPKIDAIHGWLLGLPRQMELSGEGEVFLAAVQRLESELCHPELSVAFAERPEEGETPSHAPSRLGAPVRAAVQRPLPLQRETSEAAVEASLLAAISRWNFNYNTARPFCCDRHAGLHFARQAVSGALDRPCHPRALPRSCAQCARCGILDVGGPICDTCGRSPEPEDSTRESL
mmetsp:Transcript_93878/g.289521  ORF Transcript_93878/g.289521 Transcript_93878/m.289521 type:complete len:288 (+) Transcript_93878:1-864(+)